MREVVLNQAVGEFVHELVRLSLVLRHRCVAARRRNVGGDVGACLLYGGQSAVTAARPQFGGPQDMVTFDYLEVKDVARRLVLAKGEREARRNADAVGPIHDEAGANCIGLA